MLGPPSPIIHYLSRHRATQVLRGWDVFSDRYLQPMPGVCDILERTSCMRHVGEDESCLSAHLSNLPYQQRKYENMSLQRGLFRMVRGL